jgi:predicted O-methyltransferase YrrM
MDDVLSEVTSRLDRYRAHDMVKVHGWFTAESAEVMATLLAHQVATGVQGGVAEIGVHHGKSFLLLANGVRPGERAVALDVFGLQDKNLDNSGLGDREKFEANAAAFAPGTTIDIIEATSFDVTPETARDTFGPVRLMSIDGGHTAAVTAHDLALAEACVVDDGLVVLDDVLNAHWLGVVSGLFRFLEGPTKLVPFAYSENKLYLAPSAQVATRYLAALGEALPDLLGKTGVEFHGESIDVYGQGSPRRRQGAHASASGAVTERERVRKLEEDVRKLEEDLRRERTRIAALKSSQSWRVTRPLRRLSKQARNRVKK